MAAMIQSAVSSPLSDPGSDLETFDYYRQEAVEPPPKRQRLGDSSRRGTPTAHEAEYVFSSISSDTSGEVPQSPGAGRVDDDEPIHEQVTICAWDGCRAGDVGDMDRLVEHIHNEHIEARQKKYTCEWEGCSRKSLPHASAYALKAHMRSHTREKPFYCLLPECDRSFTRSDALAKHMRTVHETEALRPSDPIPKSMQPLKNTSKLKFVIKQSSDQTSLSPTHSPGLEALSSLDGIMDVPFSTDAGFTATELATDPRELWQSLRRQLHWAKEEADSLKRENEVMEVMRKQEWIEKEILLDQVINTEISWHENRRAVLASMPPVLKTVEIKETPVGQTDGADDSEEKNIAQQIDIEDEGGDQREAAAVLASLFQA